MSRFVRIAKAVVEADLRAFRRLLEILAKIPRPLAGLALPAAIAVLAAIGAGAWIWTAGLRGSATGPTPHPATEQRPVAPQQSGYLDESVNMGSEGSWVVFLDLTSGTVYEAQRTGYQVVTESGTVTRQGSTLTIQLTQFIGNEGSGAISGTLAVHDTGGGLEVSVPMSDGTIQAYEFNSNKQVSDYNADVQRMQAQITSDQQAAAQARASASASAAAQAAQQAAQQRQQTAAIEAKQQQSCAAIGGQFQGDTSGTGDALTNTCHADPNRTWNYQGIQSGHCPPDAQVWFNSDGTVNQDALQSVHTYYPGCFN